jgi:hypothetical protein
MNNELKIGDLVWKDGYTSMAQQIFGQYPIEKVEYRYDEKTGEKYPIYLVGNEWYDGRDGGCHSNKESMYYIELDYE